MRGGIYIRFWRNRLVLSQNWDTTPFLPLSGPNRSVMAPAGVSVSMLMYCNQVVMSFRSPGGQTQCHLGSGWL